MKTFIPLSITALSSLSSLAVARPAGLPTKSNLKTNVERSVRQSPVIGLTVSKRALVDLGAVVGILSPATCPANSLVGVQTKADLLGVLSLCVCVTVGGDLSGIDVCPQCPANSHAICGSANCGCECDDGFYAYGTSCRPDSSCSAPNTLTKNSDGKSSCSCSAPTYQSDNAGGCVCKSPYTQSSSGTCNLPPSSRARLTKKGLDAAIVVNANAHAKVDPLVAKVNADWTATVVAADAQVQADVDASIKAGAATIAKTVNEVKADAEITDDAVLAAKAKLDASLNLVETGLVDTVNRAGAKLQGSVLVKADAALNGGIHL